MILIYQKQLHLMVTVIYNCAIINIGCGNTTNITKDTINNSNVYLSKSLNSQSKNQLNDYITMKLTDKILIILILIVIVICIGGYGYRRKI